MNPSPSERRWLWLVPVPLALILLYFALRGVEWKRVGETVSHARVAILMLALPWSFLSYFARALRWRVLLNAGAPNRRLTVFWANSLGYLGNNFLPGRAGELIRTVMVSSRSTLTRSFVLTTALVERASDLLFLIIAASIALAVMPGKPEWLTGASSALAVVGAVAAIGLAVIPKTQRLAAWAFERPGIPRLFREKILGILEQVRMGVATLHDGGRLTKFLAFTVAIWTMDVLGTMLLAYALRLRLSFSAGLLLITGLGFRAPFPPRPGIWACGNSSRSAFWCRSDFPRAMLWRIFLSFRFSGTLLWQRWACWVGGA